MLSKNNALDFNDLIFKTIELFKTCPEILDYYSEKFKFIFVDEYQDTNDAQYEIIKLLASKHRNICVVGDIDQSIYGWRGANISNILNFENDFKNSKIILLEENYRSTQKILDCANELIKNNVNRKEKNLWTKKEGGDEIIYKNYQNENFEALEIADTISNLYGQGYDLSDIAVLYRGKSAKSGETGDLILTVNIESSDEYERDGDDFYKEVEIPLKTMLFGGKMNVATLQKDVTIKIAENSKSGQKIRLKGYGVKNRKSGLYGDLYLKTKVLLPDANFLDEDLIKIMKEKLPER